MKYHTMLRYIINLFFLLIFSIGVTQQDSLQLDTLKIKQKYGLRIGVDLSKQIRMVTENYTGFSIYSDIYVFFIKNS